MDDLTDPFLSSPSWWEMNASGRSSWVGASVTQANSLLAGSIGTYESDEKSASICMIPSNHIMGNISAEESNLHGHDGNSSILVDMNMKYGINKDMLPTENQPKHEVQNHIPSACQHAKAQESSFSVKGVNESNPSAGSFGSELNASCSVTLLHGAVTDACSINSNGSELTAFPQSLGNSHSISSVSTMWPPTYCSVSSLLMEQGNVQGLGLQGVESDAEMLREACFGDSKFLMDQSELNSQSYSFLTGQQIKSVESNGLLPHRQEQHELPNVHLPSFASGPQMSLPRPAGISRQQSDEANNIKHYSLNTSGTQSQSTPSNAGGCNGVVKPRVRARRGQATDPHSIAERLRREKIAERMKNLQELVPNSNKSDKASMLDEIIEYVKFLQLQVKVLSMSRLGAAGAVVPLITDAQSEASGGLHLSSSVGQGLVDPSESQENLAFEQEVVKLMESNVTTAMQFLQNKGLCLMPIALASAISSQKGQSAAIPRDVKEADVTHGMISPSGREGAPGGCNGAVVKQEEATKPMGSMKELKLKS